MSKTMIAPCIVCTEPFRTAVAAGRVLNCGAAQCVDLQDEAIAWRIEERRSAERPFCAMCDDREVFPPKCPHPSGFRDKANARRAFGEEVVEEAFERSRTMAGRIAARAT